MGSKNNFIVVIGRQFGCGGSRIGKRLAERLNVSYYDKRLLDEAARKHGFDPKLFERADEKRPHIVNSILQAFYGVTDSYTGSPLSKEGLYKFQSDAIRSIVAKESCVILGRTADYVMRDNPRLLSVFLHAPEDYRANAIVERGDAPTKEEAISLAHKRDSSRENYYNFFTGRHWGHAPNYHLTIDASRMSEEKIVELIAKVVEELNNSTE